MPRSPAAAADGTAKAIEAAVRSTTCDSAPATSVPALVLRMCCPLWLADGATADLHIRGLQNAYNCLQAWSSV
ncbi:hypothetical protein GCM10010452_24410 [Crossiella cryophila]